MTTQKARSRRKGVVFTSSRSGDVEASRISTLTSLSRIAARASRSSEGMTVFTRLPFFRV